MDQMLAVAAQDLIDVGGFSGDWSLDHKGRISRNGILGKCTSGSSAARADLPEWWEMDENPCVRGGFTAVSGSYDIFTARAGGPRIDSPVGGASTNGCSCARGRDRGRPGRCEPRHPA